MIFCFFTGREDMLDLLRGFRFNIFTSKMHSSHYPLHSVVNNARKTIAYVLTVLHSIDFYAAQ